MQYGDLEEGMVQLSIRRVQEHDEADKDERVQLEKVRCFLTNVKWTPIEEEDDVTVGITWLELYIYYAIHGGCKEIIEARKEKPLSKAMTLQTAIATFKARTRKIAKHCTEREEEVHTKVSYTRGNRLQKLAISNKHAGINGTPIISKIDAELITKAMLAMRGINQKQHKAEHDTGELKLMPRPMAYKGMAHAWLRNLGKLDEYDDWTAKPMKPDTPEIQQKELKVVKCPSCNEAQSTKDHKLQGLAGHSQLKCQACQEVTSTYDWLCACEIQWF